MWRDLKHAFMLVVLRLGDICRGASSGAEVGLKMS